MTSTVSIGISGSIASLKDRFLADHPRVQAAKTAPSLAIVFAEGARPDLRETVLDILNGPQAVSIFNARPGITSAVVTTGLRRSQWVDVDVDARAPRLRAVRLPKSLVESEAVAGVADLRRMAGTRPLIALGLWASLASPVQRIGSLITGAREGLAAEIGLAVRPAALIVLTRITASGPLACIVSSDPIAAELMSLATWQSRLPSTTDLPGPWEDPLVQRATELGLGVSQPSQMFVQTWFDTEFSTDDITTTRRHLSGVVSLIGIDHTDSLEIAGDRGDV